MGPESLLAAVADSSWGGLEDCGVCIADKRKSRPLVRRSICFSFMGMADAWHNSLLWLIGKGQAVVIFVPALFFAGAFSLKFNF